MGTKYDFRTVRSEVVRHLAFYFPDDLSLFQKAKSRKMLHDPPEDCDFWLLHLARKCDAQVALPAILYSCAIHPLSAIFNSAAVVGLHDLGVIVTGRENMMKQSYVVAGQLLKVVEDCRSWNCQREKTIIYFNHGGVNTFVPPALPPQVKPMDLIPHDNDDDDVCNDCARSCTKAMNDVRDGFWAELPAFFALGSWEELRKATCT